MNVMKTPEEQAKFDRMRIYFKFEARREYLRVQTTIQQSYETALQKQREAEQKAQEAEQKMQESEQKMQQALTEIERLKVLLNKQS